VRAYSFLFFVGVLLAQKVGGAFAHSELLVRASAYEQIELYLGSAFWSVTVYYLEPLS